VTLRESGSETLLKRSLLVLSIIVHANWVAAGLYENREKGFACTAPSGGWQFSEHDSGARWLTANESVILSARHVLDIPVEVTPQYLEKLFNGFDSDTNTDLVESNRGTLNGYPAYTAIRRQKDTLSRLTVLVIGQRCFLMSLTASEMGHTQYGHIYDQMVTSFRAQGENVSQPVQQNQQEDPERSPSSPPLPHLFRGRGLGFTVNYPKGWEATRLDDTTVQILGPRNTIEALIMLQGHPGAGDTPESLMEKLRAQILGDYPEAQFSTARKVVLADGLLTGQQCVAEYFEGGEQRRQWQGIMKKEDGSYIVMFVSGSQEVMMANVTKVDKIINSLSPTR
jgi:hypothetical protein